MQINSYILKPGSEPLLTPVINTITNKTNNAGTSITINPSITAASTTSFTYTWSATGLPAGITIRASDGRISGTINSSLNTQIFNVVVTVSVTNGSQTKTDTELFNWTVNKVIAGPDNSTIYRNAVGDAYGGFPAGVSTWEDTVARAGDVGQASFNTGNLAQTNGNIPNDWVSSAGNSNDNFAVFIKNFEIGRNCTSIGSRAFFTSTPLDFHFKTNIGIPESVVSIGLQAFQGKRNLCQVMDDVLTIPSSVRSIGNYAFRSCTNLNGLVIKEGVQDIGRYAFGALPFVNTPCIRIPDSVTTLDFAAFSGFTRHQGDVYYGKGLRSGNGTYGNKPYNGVVGGQPMKNLYINCPYSAAEAVNGFANFFSTASGAHKIYISPQYYNDWMSQFGNAFNFYIYFACPQTVPRLQWTSFPDAMDGAWSASDFD